MLKSNLQSSFEEFCKNKKFEINDEQLIIIDSIEKFINPKKTFLKNFFNKRDELCFYLHGSVGVGKTMLMDFVYNELEIYQTNSNNASTCLLELSRSASKSYPPSKIETTLPSQNFFVVFNILSVMV